MPKIPNTKLVVNDPIVGTAPDAALIIVIDPASPMKIGTYTFQLECEDQDGNRSKAALAKVVIADTLAPTAIISAPRSVPFGEDFILSGAESSDIGGGQIARFVWTLIN
jgi:hypothetical protein